MKLIKVHIEISNSIVVFVRLLTSAFLRAHEDDYVPFLFSLEDDPRFFGGGAPTLQQFCEHHVEPTSKEADRSFTVILHLLSPVN